MIKNPNLKIGIIMSMDESEKKAWREAADKPWTVQEPSIPYPVSSLKYREELLEWLTEMSSLPTTPKKAISTFDGPFWRL